MSLLVATSKREHNVSLVDAKTPVEFGIGFAAGAMGIDPHIAVLAFLTYETAKDALQVGSRRALFEPRESQAPANKIFDILVEVTGIYAGRFVRQMYLRRQAELLAAEQAAPQPAPEQKVMLAGIAWPYTGQY